MGTQAKKRKPLPPKKAAVAGKPIALTVKVDKATYVRLCNIGAMHRRTNQDILSEALRQYLERDAE